MVGRLPKPRSLFPQERLHPHTTQRVHCGYFPSSRRG
jgi:hypothetical protein